MDAPPIPDAAGEDAAGENVVTTPTIEVPAVEIPGAQVEDSSQAPIGTAQTPAAQPSVPNAVASGTAGSGAGETRLYADTVRYEGGVIIAESRNAQGVRLESPQTRLFADSIRLDVATRNVQARGRVRVERTRLVKRRDLSIRPRRDVLGRQSEALTETLRGEDFQYSFATKRGTLDRAQLQLNGFDVSTTQLLINGKRYTARDVVLRPGGLSEAERKIYGTPPFKIKARSVTVESPDNARATNRRTGSDAGSGGPEEGGGAIRVENRSDETQIAVKGAALYYNNTRLLPVPSYVFRSLGGGGRDQSAFSLIPRASFNSADGLLLTTRLRFPLSQSALGTAFNADIGASTRIGFRGGLSLESPSRIGTFVLSGRINDVITTQLTNRILLNREPQLSYNSPLVRLFQLPGGHQAGLRFTADIGRFSERLLGGSDRDNNGSNNRDNNGSNNGDDRNRVSDTRRQAGVRFTTRANNLDGPYADVFARVARYGEQSQSYRNLGYELGYAGSLGSRVRGQFLFRSTALSGQTPFRFDQVEIRREVRTTFDVELSPRYLIPIDLRYDLSRSRFRDRSIGLLRSYKTFAYGFTYQTARRELQLAFRSGF